MATQNMGLAYKKLAELWDKKRGPTRDYTSNIFQNTTPKEPVYHVAKIVNSELCRIHKNTTTTTTIVDELKNIEPNAVMVNEEVHGSTTCVHGRGTSNRARHHTVCGLSPYSSRSTSIQRRNITSTRTSPSQCASLSGSSRPRTTSTLPRKWDKPHDMASRRFGRKRYFARSLQPHHLQQQNSPSIAVWCIRKTCFQNWKRKRVRYKPRWTRSFQTQTHYNTAAAAAAAALTGPQTRANFTSRFRNVWTQTASTT